MEEESSSDEYEEDDDEDGEEEAGISKAPQGIGKPVMAVGKVSIFAPNLILSWSLIFKIDH